MNTPYNKKEDRCMYPCDLKRVGGTKSNNMSGMKGGRRIISNDSEAKEEGKKKKQNKKLNQYEP